jgi:hypothetical protein
LRPGCHLCPTRAARDGRGLAMRGTHHHPRAK